MRRLQAETASRRYEVLVGRDCLRQIGVELSRRRPGAEVFVGCDENVAPLYLERVRHSLRDAGCRVSEVVVPAGEREKSLARVEELYGVLYDRGLKRSDVVLALGGGVVGDLFGFVAATYQRGMDVVQAPTTLLAQVDAAIGGKVGVDFRGGKNYVGAFHQPCLVLADVATLQTLPARELRSGAAEVAKYGLLRGGELLERCEALARAGLSAAGVNEELVASCAQAKIEVVRADEREQTGARAVLNLGHTIGHAVEVAGGFARYTHGEAVAMGLRAALWLSQRLTGLSAAEVERGWKLLEGLGLPPRPTRMTADDVLDLIGRDKKAAEGGVGYVLLERLGKPVTGVTVPAELEREAVTWLLQ